MASSSLFRDFSHTQDALLDYNHFGGNAKLDGVIAACRRALASDVVRADKTLRPKWTILRASALRLRAERDGSEADLDVAKHLLEAVIGSEPVGSPIHTEALFALGLIFETLYEHEVSTAPLIRCHDCFRQATLQVHNDRAANDRIANELAVHLGYCISRYVRWVDPTGDIAEAAMLIEGVLPKLDNHDPLKGYALALLAKTYRWCWRVGGMSDKILLAKCEDNARRALRLVPEHRLRRRFLSALAAACLDRALVTDSTDCLEEALIVAKQAEQLIPTGGLAGVEDRAIINELASSYSSLFSQTGRLSDLESAIDCLRRVIENETEHEPPAAKANTAMSLANRFEITGHSIDLDDAIRLCHEAMARLPSESPFWGPILNTLGRAHGLRLGSNGERVDFLAAKGHLSNSLERCKAKPSNAALRGIPLRVMSAAHFAEFLIRSKPEMLDMAVTYGRDAVDCEDPDYPLRRHYISELGHYLSRRFDLLRVTEDLVESITLHETALNMAVASDAHGDRDVMLWRYGQALRLRFELLGNQKDFDLSFAVLTEAIRRARELRAPKQALFTSELATLFSTRYTLLELEDDLQAALNYYARAARETNGFTADRFNAAVQGARLAQAYNQSEMASQSFSAAISLLPRIAWVGLDTRSRHAKLATVALQLAGDAAASAIGLGRLERAVELLEEGRSVVWRTLLQLRSDFTALQNVAPQLAQELMLIGQTLEHEDTNPSDTFELYIEERSQRRRRAAERWDVLVENVRQLPGFESFLLPQTFATLRRAADEGPVVMLNISSYRSDALIILRNQPVRCVRLPGLDFGTIGKMSLVLLQAVQSPRDKRGCQFLESVLQNIGRRLWQGGISTVADAVAGTERSPTGRPSRLWWIPTGLLSLLPVHCAAPYEVGQKGLQDMFIQSYTTTLSALINARASQHTRTAAPSQRLRMLAIAQPETPGRPPLPCAASEMQTLASGPYGRFFSFLYGAQGTVSAVTAALPQANFVHWCCHGHHDPQHPLDSAFNLYDGQLTLSRIVQMRLNNADFAFLSACHTARLTTVLPDESLHLAAGLHVAGTRGILATAWAMADRDGPVLARHFYNILAVGAGPPDARNAAEALHKAVNILRGTGVPLFRWGAFVHFGV